MKNKKAAFVIIVIGITLLIIGVILMNIPVEKKVWTGMYQKENSRDWEYEYKTVTDYPFEDEGYDFFNSGIIFSSIGIIWIYLIINREKRTMARNKKKYLK
jgi:xanthine/uracil permease